MKLNEKGFAFSTMLYGSITLIAVVLYVILNASKTTNDTTYYFGEEVIKSLNDCVSEEIALENCYSSGSSNCNATMYHSCLGISDNNTSEHGIIISEKLKELSNIELHQDDYNSNRYVVTGNGGNNYLLYANKLWRVVSIELGGYIKLVDTSKFSTLAWDNEGNGVWGSSSTLYDTLNLNYLSTIIDTSKLYQGTWYPTVLYPSLVNNYGLGDLVEQETNISTDSIKYSKVGLLSVSDYIKATGNSACKNTIFGNNSYNCNSWLSQYKGWTININGEFGSDTEGYAYYFGDDITNNKNNKVLYDKTDETHDVYPVVILDRNSIYKSGTGSESDPITLK